MPQLVTIPFRVTAEREAQLRKELKLGPEHRLTHIMIYYAIRDTVYAWLDGGQESDLSSIPDLDDNEDDLGVRRTFTVSSRPYKTKRILRIRRKNDKN